MEPYPYRVAARLVRGCADVCVRVLIGRLRTQSILTQLVNFCWSLFKWLLLFVLAGIILGGGYLYLRLDDEIRRQVEQKIAEQYPNMLVHVGRARFEQDRGIAIFDIVIAERTPDASSQPMLSIGEMYLEGRIRMEELVTSKLAITEVVIRRAALRAVREGDGRWNLQHLLPLPQLGNAAASVRIEDATLIVVDAARPAAAKTIQGIDVTLAPMRSDAPQATGARHFEVKASANGAPAGELKVEGVIGTNDGVLDLTAKIAGLEVSSETIAALPGMPADCLAGAEVSGRADAAVKISRPGAGSPIEWTVDVTIDRGRLSHAKLPAPLSEIRCSAVATAQRLTIKRLDAKYGSAGVALAVDRAGWARNAPVALAASVVGLQLDDRLPAQMPESMARVWQRFKPTGTVDATLRMQFDGKDWRPNLTATCRGVSLTDMDKFPCLVQQSTGQLVYKPSEGSKSDQLTIDLTGSVAGRPVRVEADLRQLRPREPDGVTTDSDVAERPSTPGHQSVGYRGRPTLRGAAPRPHPVGWVRVTGTDIPIHDELIAAIPEHGQPFVRSLHAEGNVDFRFVSEWKDPKQPRADVQLDIGLKDCTAECERFPLPLRNVRGLVTATDWHWKVEQMTALGAQDSTVVTGRGTVVPQGGVWLADLNFDAKSLPLDETLRTALSPSAQHAWDELRPHGRIDAAVHVTHDTRQKESVVEVSMRPVEDTVSLYLAKFPYRLEHVTGEAEYRPGRVDFRNVRARHDREQFSAETGLWTATDGGGWQLELSGCYIDRISPHRELIGALPQRLQKAIDRLQPSGTFGVYDSKLSFAKLPNTDRVAAAWNVNLDCHQAVFRGGLPLQSVTGGVRLFGRDDHQLAYSAGELDLDSVVLRDIQLTNVRGPLWVDSAVCYFGEQATQKLGQPPRRLTADAYGGSLASNVTVQHDSGPTYQIDLALGAGDLARFANERLGGPTDMNGTVSGRLTLTGSGASLQSLNGTGEMYVVDANIYRLPLLVSMLKVPNLRNRTPDTTAFNRCDMKFNVQGDHVYFEQLNLLGETVSLYGKGESGFDRQIDLVFYTLLETPIPLWKTIAGQVSQQTLQLKVVGTWDDPDVRPETLPGINQVLDQLQNGLQGATGGGASATAKSGPAPARGMEQVR